MPAPAFMFATGIENGIPTINGGRTRIDQMEKCGHYRHWRTDFELLRELDIHFLRYGPPLHTSFLGPGRYDWNFADATFGALKELDIVPIVDLCHFGVPDWIGNFQNPDFPGLSRNMRRRSRGASHGSSSIRPSTRCSSAPSSRRPTAGGTSR